VAVRVVLEVAVPLLVGEGVGVAVGVTLGVGGAGVLEGVA